MAKIIVSDEQKWRLLRDTVEGRQSTASCVFRDGQIVFSAMSIPKGAKPNLKLLSEVLRSDEPLPPLAREWLADLFDPDGAADFHVKSLTGRRGAKKVGISNNWDAAEYALMRMDCGDQADDTKAGDSRGDKWEAAVAKAADKFHISESAVEAAITSYREAKEINDRIV